MNTKKSAILSSIEKFLKVKSILKYQDVEVLKLIEDPSYAKKYPDLFSELNLIYINTFKTETIKVLHKLADDEILEDYLKIVKILIITRINNDVTIKDLSKASNVPEITIRRAENLQAIMELSTFLKLCKTLKCKININKFFI